MEPITNIDDLIRGVIKRKSNAVAIRESLKQLNPEEHDVVASKLRRPDKIITTDKGDEPVKVARIPLGFQNIIVSRAVAFLLGESIKIRSSADNKNLKQATLIGMIQKTWDDNKLDYKSKNLAKAMMGEMECAEIWYADEVDPKYWGELSSSSEYRMRMKIVSPSRGDVLYPVFDELGDLIGFGRKYKIKNAAGKTVERFDYYTPERTLFTEFTLGKWELVEDVPNELGKIPVIYYNQQTPEWAIVQRSIDRLEFLISNFADTNDYFGSPTVVTDGEVLGFAKKGESGKVLKVKNGASVKYLTWDAAPEAVKLEIEFHIETIYTLTQTPNIAFKEMKGIGPVSGTALHTLLIDGQLKAQDKQEGEFGECMQRRLNLLKAFMIDINPDLASESWLSVWPEFGKFRINNTKEDIENIATALNSGFLSRETAIGLNPLIDDPELERERIELEASQSLDTEFDI